VADLGVKKVKVRKVGDDIKKDAAVTCGLGRKEWRVYPYLVLYNGKRLYSCTRRLMEKL